MRSKSVIAGRGASERTHCRNTEKLTRLILAAKVRRQGRERVSLGRRILNVLTHSVGDACGGQIVKSVLSDPNARPRVLLLRVFAIAKTRNNDATKIGSVPGFDYLLIPVGQRR